MLIILSSICEATLTLVIVHAPLLIVVNFREVKQYLEVELIGSLSLGKKWKLRVFGTNNVAFICSWLYNYAQPIIFLYG